MNAKRSGHQIAEALDQLTPDGALAWAHARTIRSSGDHLKFPFTAFRFKQSDPSVLDRVVGAVTTFRGNELWVAYAAPSTRGNWLIEPCFVREFRALTGIIDLDGLTALIAARAPERAVGANADVGPLAVHLQLVLPPPAGGR